jgi:aryl-alcohol dehydrogenase-like predicted oxidoreductase
MTNRLILGGHSFIKQLGNDPMPTEDQQCNIVAACIAAGIVTFDATYLPERVALGKALARTGLRDKAKIIAWNFFQDFGPEDSVSGHAPYQPHHLEQMLTELQTDHIERLVVHPVDDPAEHERQEKLAVSWLEQGVVGQLGTWMPPIAANHPKGPYSFAVAPCNIRTTDAAERFEAYKNVGWETVATSPFVRGWELEKQSAGRPIVEVADAMLRYATYFPNVDQLIVAMRRVGWIATNCASVAKGPLSAEEVQWLLGNC